MPDLTVSEAQLERLEEISADLEAVYVGEYGTVRPTDAVQYLLDTYTPPDPADAGTADGAADAADALLAIDGVGEATAEALLEKGFETVEAIGNADPQAIAEIRGIGEDQAGDIVSSAASIEPSDAADGSGVDDGDGRPPSDDDPGAGSDPSPDDTPEDTLQQAMSLLDAHEDRWRESSDDEPYEVDLPDGSTTGVRTKDDVKRLIFKHWR